MASANPSTEGPWLVFGLTGPLGRAFADGLQASDPPLLAVSRRPQAASGRIAWRQGGLADMPDPAVQVAAIVSLGPLDAFAQWFEGSSLAPCRIVAIGSTSVHAKKDSPDPAERALAHALRDAERRLAAAATARGTALTVLRPTLLYGRGSDRTLSRLVGLGRRWRLLPLPLRAGGLRQPVHVDDVAAAVLGALRARLARPGFFDLPGGEVLGFDQMVMRTLAAAAPGTVLLRLPGPLFRTGVRMLRGLGRLDAAGDGVLVRLDQDLVYDAGPARNALDHYPRGFQPSADMFPA